MTLKRRIGRLEEKNPVETLVWLRVPETWSEEQQKSAVEAYIRSIGVQEPYKLTTYLNACAEIEPLLVGGPEEVKRLLEHIAKYGSRVGETPARRRERLAGRAEAEGGVRISRSCCG